MDIPSHESELRTPAYLRGRGPHPRITPSAAAWVHTLLWGCRGSCVVRAALPRLATAFSPCSLSPPPKSTPRGSGACLRALPGRPATSSFCRHVILLTKCVVLFAPWNCLYLMSTPSLRARPPVPVHPCKTAIRTVHDRGPQRLPIGGCRRPGGAVRVLSVQERPRPRFKIFHF